MNLRFVSLIFALLAAPLTELPALVGVLFTIPIIYGFVLTSPSPTNTLLSMVNLLKPLIVFTVAVCMLPVIYFIRFGKPPELNHPLSYMVLVFCQSMLAYYSTLMLWCFLNRAKFRHAEADTRRPVLVIGS